MKKNVRYELQYKNANAWVSRMRIVNNEDMYLAEAVVDSNPRKNRIVELHPTVIYPKPKARVKR